MYYVLMVLANIIESLWSHYMVCSFCGRLLCDNRQQSRCYYNDNPFWIPKYIHKSCSNREYAAMIGERLDY